MKSVSADDNTRGHPLAMVHLLNTNYYLHQDQLTTFRGVSVTPFSV